MQTRGRRSQRPVEEAAAHLAARTALPTRAAASKTPRRQARDAGAGPARSTHRERGAHKHVVMKNQKRKAKCEAGGGSRKKLSNARGRVRYRARLALKHECSELGICTSMSDIHVLASRHVPALALRTLSQGPKYAPTASPGAYVTAESAAARMLGLGRRMAWRIRYAAKGDESHTPRILVPRAATAAAPWPPMRTAQGAYATMRASFGLNAGRVERIVRSFRYTEPVYRNNLPLPMRAALDKLQCLRDSVIVRPADKNMGTVVADKDWYNRLCIEYLSDNSKFALVQQEPDSLLHECAHTVARAVTFHFALLTVYLALLSDLKSDCKAGIWQISDSAYLLSRGLLRPKGKAESRVSRRICLRKGPFKCY